MKNLIKTVFGILFVLAALFGVVLSVVGTYYVWREKTTISIQIDESLTLLDQTMTTTQHGLSIMAATLENASTEVAKIQETSASAADTLATTTLTLDSLSVLFGTKLNNVVTDTQLSLSSAETSATLIDNTLMVISAIPLIGARYEPQTSLAASMDQISESLGALPASFSEIEQNLASTSSNLSDIQKDIEELYTTMDDIEQNLQDAQVVIQEYQGISTNIEQRLLQFHQNIPQRLNKLAWGITFILIWLGIASLGLFTQGVELLRKK